MNKIKEFILGAVVIFCLILYCYIIWIMINKAIHWDLEKCGPLIYSNDLVWLANVVGALISAVVIANLARTETGKVPVAHIKSFINDLKPNTLTFFNIITITYIIVWLLLSGWIIYIGLLKYPNVNVTLNEMGKSCIGIILGAAYAYFGLTKQDNQNN